MRSALYCKTPLLESLPLSTILGCQVYLKMEALQPSGSFKNRGIGHLCSHYAKEEKARLFVSSSGGNAGLAVAYAGRQLHVPVKVVVPKTTLEIMVNKIRSENAEVIVHGKDWNAADTLARELAQKAGCFYISPFDHPLIWEGHSTLVQELVEQNVKPDTVVIAVGGGGLFCGIIQGLKKIGWNDVTVLTAETEGAASLAKSMQAEKRITLDSIHTIATSLGAKTVAAKAFELSQQHPVIPYIVSDNQAVDALLQFADHHRILVEPACGAALSLAYSKKIDPAQYKKVVIIVCGGSAISRALMQQWAEKLSN